MVNNGYHKYQRTNVTSSSPETLVVLLYTELLRCLTTAREAQLQNDYATKNKHTTKAIKVLTELMVSIDMEKGEQVAVNLVMLYEYAAKKLLQFGRHPTTEPFDEAIKLFAPLKEAWEAIADPRQASPLCLPVASLPTRLEPVKA